MDGLIELADGEGAAALPHLRRAVEIANGRGRRYEAATIELELARAHGLAGDGPAAAETRARTEAYLARSAACTRSDADQARAASAARRARQ